jgi:NAD+ kinase
MKRLRLLLVVNETKPAAVRAGLEIAEWAKSRGIDCGRAVSPVGRVEGTVVCALGGDGTVLRAAALVAGAAAPVLGINVGSLGFLSQTSLEGLFPALEAIAKGEYTVEERMRLGYRAGELFGTALNDVVVVGARPRLLEMRLSWGDELAATLPGDGMVFSTPTGTTAYSLSLGGPIATPTARCIVVTPHAAHVLGARSLVFSPEDEVRLTASAEARILVDGDDVGCVPAGTGVLIRRAADPTLLVRPAGAIGFFRALADKLNWPIVDSRRAR